MPSELEPLGGEKILQPVTGEQGGVNIGKREEDDKKAIQDSIDFIKDQIEEAKIKYRDNENLMNQELDDLNKQLEMLQNRLKTIK